MNDAGVLGPPERLHPLSLLSSLTGSLKGMWGLFAAGGYFAAQGKWGIALAALGIFAALSLGAAILRWWKFSFQVGAREIRIDSGLLSRIHRSIPFDRIQDVTVEQGPVARVFGLARVRFETGGSAGSKEDDGSLAAIPLARAGEIRELVRASRGLGTVPAAAATEVEAEDTPIFAMNLPRVLLAGLFNFSLAVVGALVGATQTFGDVIGFDPFDDSFWDSLLASGSPLADFIRAHQIAAVLAGALTLVAIGLGTGVLRTLLREYGFRLDRRETGLRRRRGLLTLTDVSLPLKRIQAAVIASGPVRARFGWHELKLQSLAQDESGKGDHVVAPLADSVEVGDVLGAIGYPPLGEPGWRRVSKAYIWALVVSISPLFLIFALQLVAFSMISDIVGEAWDGPVIGVLTPILFATAAVSALFAILIALRWLDWRRYAYALDGERLIVRSGWWRRRIKILPLRSIQSIDYHQSFVARRFGIASLQIGVAGGRLTSHGVKALPAETARALRRDLLSRFE